MIQLNVDFGLLNKFFGIPVSRITQYANKDIDEIMKIEAAQGNKKAAEYEKILSDPDKILEIFKLSNVENKFIILQNLNEEDLTSVIPTKIGQDGKLVTQFESIYLEDLGFLKMDLLGLRNLTILEKWLNNQKLKKENKVFSLIF